MFHGTIEFVKRHPYAIGGGLLLLVVLYVVFGAASGSSSGGGTVAGPSSPTDAEVQSAAAVNIAQIQGNVAAGQSSAQLQALNIQTAAQVTGLQIGAQVQNYQTEQAANVSQAGIAANENVQISGQQSQVAIAVANAALQSNIAAYTNATDVARINAVASISNAPYDLQKAQIAGLGPNGLADVLNHAEGTKNSFISIGGITAGRNTPQNNSAGAIASGIGSIGAAIAAII